MEIVVAIAELIAAITVVISLLYVAVQVRQSNKLARAQTREGRLEMSEDVVVPVPNLGKLLDRTRALAETTKTRLPSYGHAGDGNLHVNFLWDSPDDWPRVRQGIEQLFLEDAQLFSEKLLEKRVAQFYEAERYGGRNEVLRMFVSAQRVTSC